MDLATTIRHRLQERGLDQRELALAAEVTESYISQLLSGKKLPPASDRTEVYKKIALFLDVPERQLTNLADAERQDKLKLKVLHPPRPLFREFRSMIVRKCAEARRSSITTIFNREPFGEFERLITQTVLDVTKRSIRDELNDPEWLKRFARLTRQAYEQAQVSILDFLDTDIFHITLDNWVSLLGPLIDRWDIDLESFEIEVVFNAPFIRSHTRNLKYCEAEPIAQDDVEPGLTEFLDTPALSQGITDQEIAFLQNLRLPGQHPAALYYYRELQNLRDPVNFMKDPFNPGSTPAKPVRRSGPRASSRQKSVNWS